MSNKLNKILIFYSVFFYLQLFPESSEDISKKYVCPQLELQNNKCMAVEYSDDGTEQTIYITKCSGNKKCGKITSSNDNNVILINNNIEPLFKYCFNEITPLFAGDKCNFNSDCFSNRCISNKCESLSKGEKCYSSNDNTISKIQSRYRCEKGYDCLKKDLSSDDYTCERLKLKNESCVLDDDDHNPCAYGYACGIFFNDIDDISKKFFLNNVTINGQTITGVLNEEEEETDYDKFNTCIEIYSQDKGVMTNNPKLCKSGEYSIEYVEILGKYFYYCQERTYGSTCIKSSENNETYYVEEKVDYVKNSTNKNVTCVKNINNEYVVRRGTNVDKWETYKYTLKNKIKNEDFNTQFIYYKRNYHWNNYEITNAYNEWYYYEDILGAKKCEKDAYIQIMKGEYNKLHLLINIICLLIFL